jgi:hypothetical protein
MNTPYQITADYLNINKRGYITGSLLLNEVETKEIVTNEVSTLSGHFTNEVSTLSGNIQQLIESQSPSSPPNYSFFFDYPYTGYGIAESFISQDFEITGIKIGCYESGIGPAHLSSGASGDLVNSPLTGNIYQRTVLNEKIIGNTFGIDSGQYYISLPVSYLITGDNRIGIDILSGLSGLKGLTINILG